MFKRHLRYHYAIGAELELTERVELSSRPNPGLTVYKTAALPLCYASMVLAARFELASFQLR